ncbi:GTP pyrophosphokinase [Pseudomonas sp. Os17]|uniref:RelA/SpoT domain-containing protein n=1 Tax=Pseudomonas sp. Os17 TaxID=1500686 RepID=UPI0005FC4267|nr:hypothetical protein [Pseudomonas sp. Os17]BAQ75111.1 GTP pyrophosphokinase [Pseudomonas sp. Os17]
MELNEFLEKNRITQEDWIAADIEWEQLLSIFSDHSVRIRQLEDTANFFVKSMQSFEGVHSVRWRVKDPEHLIEKIVRKRSEPNASEKYKSISVENYHEVVTDLIGVRALHLFKDDCLPIHSQIKKMWEFNEAAVSYIREGDRSELIEALEQNEIAAKVHPAGYRSVHYVLKTKPGLREVLVEVQVRTVFEEAWSEIDHTVRYPNFSDNKQLVDVLKIFNRLAGSADEMGGFIKSLSNEFDEIDERIVKADLDRDKALGEMQKLVSQLASAQQLNSEAADQVNLLQKELDNVKDAIRSGSEDVFATESHRYYVSSDGKKYRLKSTSSIPRILRSNRIVPKAGM